MHIQELKDTARDKLRNGQTVSLALGDRLGRWSVGVSILAWWAFCPLYLRAGLLASVLPMTMGAYVAFRALWIRSLPLDRWSWQMWDLGLVSLYLLPLVEEHNTS